MNVRYSGVGTVSTITDAERSVPRTTVAVDRHEHGEPREPTQVVWLDSVSSLGTLRDEWLQLAEDLPAASYFQTPDWVLAWWRTIGGEPRTAVAVWRNDAGGLDAVVALSRVRQPLHRRVPFPVPVWINAGSGTGAGDHCGWLVRPHRQEAVWDWVRRQTGRETLLLQNVDRAHGPASPLLKPVWDTICPRCHVADVETKYSSNFRQQLRARERKIRRMGVTLRWVDPPAVDDRVLDALFSLHQNRWRQKNGRSSFAADHLALHRMLAASSAPGRGPGAVIAEHEGTCIGVLYGFWWRDSFAYYQMGWDPAWAKYSVGLVLLRDAIKMTRERGGQVFDFLRGPEPFKYRFGAEDRVDTTWLLPKGWTGPVLRSGFAGRRVLRTIRRSLEERARGRDSD
ncbi:MAG TPA: GNAT family N-acetyltransferase [Vicinamibacterales bacterium]|nr:GNAT family N-acetyltransferase [Vicinamibacterales bacterium]